MKYKILVIDDEILIRNAVSKLILNELPQCLVVGEAENADKAIQLAEETMPDIIITDIYMPGISGLDMIEKLTFPVKTIVITGFRDFDKAHQAINLNVSAMILKPIKKNELISAIKNAINEIEKEGDVRTQVNSDIGYIKKNIDYLKQRKILDLINGCETLQNPGVLQEGDITLNIDKFSLVFINFTNYSGNFNIYSEFSNIQYDLKNAFYEQADKSILCSIVNNDNIVVVTAMEENTTVQSIITSCMEFIDILLYKYPEMKIKISVSTSGKGENELSKKYKECIKALSINKLIEGNTVIYYGDINSAASIEQPIFLEILSHKNMLLNALSDLNTPVAWYCFEKISKFAVELKDTNIKFIHEFYYHLLLRLYEVRETVGKNKMINPDELYSIISKCNNISDLNDTVKMCLKSIIDDMENRDTKEYSKHVRIMVKYIDENYTKKISLQDVAESVHMSINHACRLFKNEFGKTILSYINELKINKAKDLLTNGNYKVFEIANVLGYDNVNYFSTIFKKYTQESPSDYQQKNNKNF